MVIKKSSMALAAGTYVLWGSLPIYWNLLVGVDSLFILCCRITFSLVFVIALLAALKRMQSFRDLLSNKKALLLLAPASLFITYNWGLYIWAVNAGYIIDCSIGYFMNPLVVFVLGVIMFKEKCSKLQVVSVAFAVVGVLISVIAYGKFPIISITLAVSFSLYGVCKKKAKVDPIASIAVETMFITPFMIAFALIFKSDVFRTLDISDILLLIGAGVVTATPLVLYSRIVNDIPFMMVGFFQYISPAIQMVYGLLRGEAASPSQMVSFAFILVGLIVFSFDTIRKSKEPDKLPPKA